MHASALGAQQPQRDTTRGRDTISVRVPLSPAESLLVTDSARARAARDTTPPRDSIQAPLSRTPVAPTLDIGAEWQWTRDELFASGAVTLLDLLERIPGVTGFRAGWVSAPQVAAYLGDPGAVRIYLDGIALDILNPRDGRIRDLAAVPIWMLEHVTVEQGAGELRVYLRSWESRRTTPNTRTDVLTGDQQTNIFRGFFGRRFGNGAALQVAAQQWGSDADRTFPGQSQPGGGDELTLLARTGWARGAWSADAFIVRASRHRQVQEGIDVTIPPLENTTTVAYVRAGYGDPVAGPWAQLVAASHEFDEHTPGEQPAEPPAEGEPAPPTDTTRSRAQYVAMGGMTLGRFRVSATGRLRVFEHDRYLGGSARASFDGGRLGMLLYGEHEAVDSLSRVEGTLRLTPFSRLQLLLGGGVVSSTRAGDSDRALPFARAEAGIRVGRMWVGGGALWRDTLTLAAVPVFGGNAPSVRSDPAIAAFGFLRGPLWKAVSVDASAIRWDAPDVYRPQTQARTRLILATRWLSRFPSGNFGVRAVVEHEYRGPTIFPTADGAVPVPHLNLLSSLLEIRILDAVLTWQVRNWTGIRYATVPGLPLARPINLYGVRWEFWN